MSSDSINDSSNEKAQAKKKGLTKTQKIIISGFAAVIIVIAVAGVILYSLLQKEPPVEQTGRNRVVNRENLEEILQERDIAADENMFRLKMNTVWNFSSAKKASEDASVANSNSNRRPFFIEVSLADTGEIVYTSDVIPVGYSIKDITLDKVLEPGSYPAICKYNTLDSNDEITNSFNIDIEIVIKN